MAVVINGSGTVTGISVGGLPDGIVDSGTLATNSVDSAELVDGSIDTAHIAADQITSAIMPAGSVLQVVSATYSTSLSLTTATYTDTGLTATITPKFATSKILITGYLPLLKTTGGNTYTIPKLLRGSTAILEFGRVCYDNSTSDLAQSASFNYLDSPATDLAVTYKTQINNGSASGVVVSCWDNRASTITLMEIAG